MRQFLRIYFDAGTTPYFVCSGVQRHTPGHPDLCHVRRCRGQPQPPPRTDFGATPPVVGPPPAAPPTRGPPHPNGVDPPTSTPRLDICVLGLAPADAIPTTLAQPIMPDRQKTTLRVLLPAAIPPTAAAVWVSVLVEGDQLCAEVCALRSHGVLHAQGETLQPTVLASWRGVGGGVK